MTLTFLMIITQLFSFSLSKLKLVDIFYLKVSNKQLILSNFETFRDMITWFQELKRRLPTI